jgi:hypothetical protein
MGIFYQSLLLMFIISDLSAQEEYRSSLGQRMLDPEVIASEQEDFEQHYIHSLSPLSSIPTDFLRLAVAYSGEPQQQNDFDQKVEHPTHVNSSSQTEQPEDRTYLDSLDKIYLRHQFEADPSAPKEELLQRHGTYLQKKLGLARFEELMKSRSEQPARTVATDFGIVFPPRIAIPRISPNQKGYVLNFRDSTGALTTFDLEEQLTKTEVSKMDDRCQSLVDKWCADQLEDTKCLKQHKSHFPPECKDHLKKIALGIICNNQVRRYCGSTLNDNASAAKCLEEKVGSFTPACQPRAQAISSQIRALQAQGKK